MHYTFAQYEESGFVCGAAWETSGPEAAMILGSGLGYMGDEVEQPVVVLTGTFPISKRPSPLGHKGQMVFECLRRRVSCRGGCTTTRAIRMRRCPTRGEAAAGRGHPDRHQRRRLHQQELEGWRPDADHRSHHLFLESLAGGRICPNSACGSRIPAAFTRRSFRIWPTRRPGNCGSC